MAHDERKAISDAKNKSNDANEGIVFNPLKVKDLLVLAGGSADTDSHIVGENALQQRTILAKKVRRKILNFIVFEV